MNIDKLKEKAEDVTVVEESTTETPKQLTEEEQKIVDEFYEKMIRKKLQPRIDSISHYMDLTKKKLSQVFEDIKNKRSGLSYMERMFLTEFKRDYINQLFKKKYL